MAQVRADMAGVVKDVENLGTLVRNLTPLNERTATLMTKVDGIEDDVGRVEKKFDQRWDRLEAAQNDARKDSRSLRNILIGVGFAAVLSPIGGIAVALLVGGPK